MTEKEVILDLYVGFLIRGIVTGKNFDDFSFYFENKFKETRDTIYIFEMMYMCFPLLKPLPEWCQKQLYFLSMSGEIKFNKTKMGEVRTRWRNHLFYVSVLAYRKKGLKVEEAIKRVAKDSKLEFSTVERIYKNQGSLFNKELRAMKKEKYKKMTTRKER